MQLVRAQALETLVAENKPSFDPHARLETRPAYARIPQLYIRANRPLTRMFIWQRDGGVTWLHACHLPEATRK